MFGKGLEFSRKLADSYRYQGVDREDLIQELSLVILKIERRYRDKPNEERDKLARVSMRNKARDFFRRKRYRDKLFISLDEMLPVAVPCRKLEQVEREISYGSEILKKLSEGFSVRETARLTGVNYRKIYRGLKRTEYSL